MDGQPDTVYQTGLGFFGIISASISHEIKNTLAVISESAGLIEDLLLVAEKGIPVDDSRLKKSVKRIQAHVERGDGIVRNMNAFAHSIDLPFRQSDVNEIIRLTAALIKRKLEMQGISLKVETPREPLFVKTAPFFLKNLAWLIAEFAAERIEESKILCLVVEKTATHVDISFSGLGRLDAFSSDSFPTKTMKLLLDILQSELEVNTDSRRLILKIRDLSGVD